MAKKLQLKLMKLKSFKNNVTLYNTIVIKQYIYGDLENELRILKLLHGKINCPKVVFCNTSVLHLEFIDGSLFLDEILLSENKCDSLSVISLFSLLFTYLKDFYSITGNIYGDINFRNFIVKSSEIYGIDFEDAKSGDIKMEIIDVLAYFLAYVPQSSPFKLACLPSLICLANTMFSCYIKESDVFLQFENIINRRLKKNNS